MLLSDILARREEVRAAALRWGAANPRLFGSVARGEERADSDIDVLVDAGPNSTLLSLGGLSSELAEMFGRTADVRTPGDLHPLIRQVVENEAVRI